MTSPVDRPHRRVQRFVAIGCAVMMALPPAFPVRAAGPERVALVIGNSAYGAAALPNPKNDARAVAELLQKAGFQVDMRIDSTRSDMVQSIGRFGQHLKNPEVKFAVFYYAGHGLQQDWRNYLVPIDAKVANATDVQKQTVDVSELMRFMSEARGRSYLVILDACREDPFVGTYRPPAKGLSPFDAPSGSLLAYATAPGQLAYDGKGSNGLYTKYLVRELAVPDTPLEDAFKRVRLNVRMESEGRQIPWESTSLEQDVMMFPQHKAKLSDAELEKRFEDELAAWSKVRNSNNIAGLTEFIRAYPSGNASELAQARLNRLLEEELRKGDEARRAAARQKVAEADALRLKAEAQERDRQAAAMKEAARLAAERQAAERQAAAELKALEAARQKAEAQQREADRREALRVAQQRAAEAEARQRKAEAEERAAAEARQKQADAARQELERLASAADTQRIVANQPALLPSVSLASTPYFQGLNPHRRDYRVGDTYEFRVIDQFTKASRPLTMKVTAVDEAADRVEYNNGETSSDLMGNTTGNARGSLSTPRQFYPAELTVGHRWRTTFKQARPSGLTYTFSYDVKVAAKETITVPAGTFEAYRIEARGFNVGLGAQVNRTIWVSPGINADIAHETYVRLSNGRIEQNDRQELVAYSRK
ncbi:caspase family protein [Aquabacterium sp.]|uniref:caspase family protein n=1 Tax=Aquabacterium sp. TaxID=1872578 RepID=UPI003784EB2F